jgi:hypothetical protein
MAFRRLFGNSLFSAALLATALGGVLVWATVDGLSVQKVRQLLQKMAGANLNKEQVQIKKITGGLTGSDAVVEARIETAFRLVKDKDDWRIAEIRLGDRQWESFELVEEAIRREKARRTGALLQKMADAIEAYRKDRGQMPDADNVGALLDYLTPRYLNPPMRFDLWGKQFEYRGERDRYTLLSAGPDGKSGTKDDLVVENGILKNSVE